MQHNTTNAGIFYRKMGNGPAMVLLHGFPADGTLWRNVWDELAVSNTVIIPDLPGSGNSPLNGDAGMADLAERINEVLAEEHIDKAVITGHSMGGYVAFAYAKLYPEKVAGLSLVHSTPAADGDEKKKTRQKSIELIQKGGKTQFIGQMVPNLFSDAVKQSNPMIVKEQIERSMSVEAASIISLYKGMMDRPDTSDVLNVAPFPVQWICGIDDNVIPYKKILGKCHYSPINFVTFYNNCGHMSMLEAPEQLTDDLKTFAMYSNRQLHLSQ